ncbi:MAG: hypothetical protein JO100_17615 [Pseudonocardia sp.]|nr:hypothetical protein [Pseudonocardia sp.]
MNRLFPCVARAGMIFLIVVVTVGCAGPGAPPATSTNNACIGVLPLAHQTVHGVGRLILVRRVSSVDVETIGRESGVVPFPPGPPGTPSSPSPSSAPYPDGRLRAPKLCLVVYQGNYPAGSVSGNESPRKAGHYVLVVAQARPPAKIGVLVTDVLPAHARHTPWWRRFF